VILIREICSAVKNYDFGRAYFLQKLGFER